MDANEMDKENKMCSDSKMLDVCEDGGVLKLVILEGSGWEKPKKGAQVKVHYVGTLMDGTKFDSSRDRNEPFKFKLGEGMVIKGWEKVVETMKKGEIAKVTLKPEYAYGKAGSPPKIPSDATLVFEIELLEWEEDKDLTNDGGVIKKILKEGKDWENPNYETQCKVHLITKGPNGEIYEDQTKDITIGNQIITEGLEKALESMKKGEKALVRVKPNYAYGSYGNPQLNIPPNTEITYEIELLEFQKGKQSWELKSYQEKYEFAVQRKTQGNSFFNEGHFNLASRKYSKALDLFKYSSEDDDHKTHKKEIDSLKTDCHLNKAACASKTGELRKAIEECNKALEIDGNNVKGLWRRANAFQQNGDFFESKRDFERALEIEPENKTVKAGLVQLKKKMAEEDRKDRERYQNLFQRLSKEQEPVSKKQKAK